MSIALSRHQTLLQEGARNAIPLSICSSLVAGKDERAGRLYRRDAMS
jgi:hypothetical protein